MALTMTRPEKELGMTEAVGEMRNTLAQIALKNELNIAEAVNAAAQVFTSILVGGYSSVKDREVVISALPDLVRAYIPQWEKVYAEFERTAR